LVTELVGDSPVFLTRACCPSRVVGNGDYPVREHSRAQRVILIEQSLPCDPSPLGGGASLLRLDRADRCRRCANRLGRLGWRTIALPEQT
jgi:hypothetical protein